MANTTTQPSYNDVHTTHQDIITALKEKITKYEAMFTEVLTGEKTIGRVLAGPFENNNVSWYRVQSGGGSNIVAPYMGDNVFKLRNGDPIPIAAEVAIVKGNIVSVIPSGLIVTEPEPEFKAIPWAKVGGLKDQLARIRSNVDMSLSVTAAGKMFGLKPGRGIMLWGPPGCGKTLIAKAIASEVLQNKKGRVNTNAFVYIKGGELLSRYIGDTEARIKAIFDNARAFIKANKGQRPVIFIDEADAILPARGTRASSDVETTIVPTFLSELSGFDSDSPFFIISTNMPDSIDPAITRPGRIDLNIEIKRPTVEEAIDIFTVHLKDVRCLDSIVQLAIEGTKAIFNMPDKAKLVSGAMIETVVNHAVGKAVLRYQADKKAPAGITIVDLQQAATEL